MTLILEFEPWQQMVEPNDVKIFHARFVTWIRKVGRAAALNAGNRYTFPQPTHVLQDRFKILIANHSDGDIVDVRNRRIVQHGGAEGDINALFLRFKRIAWISLQTPQPAALKIHRERF